MRKRLRLEIATFVPVAYWGLTHLTRLALKVIARWKVTGREHVPRSGGLIIVSNHLNNSDPDIMSAAILHRRIRYMAKSELFKSKLSFLVKLWGAFPVKRFEADLGAMLMAERLLRRGEVVGMFPEGTRSRTGYIGEFHPGTALIALRAGVPVLPCAIAGTNQLTGPLALLKQPRISVTIGEPITAVQVKRPSEEQVSALTARIVEAITGMLPAQHRPPYTGPEGGDDRADGEDNPGS